MVCLGPLISIDTFSFSIKARSSSLATRLMRILVTLKLMATPSGMHRTIRPTHNRFTIQTTIMTCLRPIIMSRWGLDPTPPAHSTPTSNGPKSRMDSTDTNGLLPPLPLRPAMFARACTPPITQTSTRGLLSHHHITLILPTQAIRDQSRLTTTTRKQVQRVTEVMGVRQAMFRLQGLAKDEARLVISMEPVEGVLANHPSEFRNAPVVR